jgi:hypothetical protein
MIDAERHPSAPDIHARDVRGTAVGRGARPPARIERWVVDLVALATAALLVGIGALFGLASVAMSPSRPDAAVVEPAPAAPAVLGVSSGAPDAGACCPRAP